MKAILLFLLAVSATSAPAQHVLKAVHGEVSFFSSAPLEDILATSKQVNSFINIVTGEIAFFIPMRSFQFDKSLMQEHFNEKYVESDKYPNATYKGKLEGEFSLTTPGKYTLTSSGTLSIHGKEKQISETGTLEVTADTVFLETKFYVALEDYDIAIPKLLFNNIAEKVEVTMRVAYLPYVVEE